MLTIVLFGPPGAGKGVQSQQLIARYGLRHISPGDIFRQETVANTLLGKRIKHYINAGNLVPEEVVIDTVSKSLSQSTPQNRGFLFDGYPRSLQQAVALDEQLAFLGITLDLAVLLEVGLSEIEQRLAIRNQVAHRADDSADKVIHRLKLYSKYSTPIISHYQTHHRTVTIDGVGSIKAVNKRIVTCVEDYLSRPTPPLL